MNIISKDDCYLFGQGVHYEIYKKLGAHPVTYRNKEGFYFAVWAPHAKAVSLVGDFNDWNPDSDYMSTLRTSGIWEIFIPGMKAGERYKYAICTRDGQWIFKADPYASYAEVRPNTASITYVPNYEWSDEKWMEKRVGSDPRRKPLSIYECHLGSWKRGLNYRQYARELGRYCKEMGYTHVEILGLAEHPYDGSWGYQVTGYYAPTSRYGSPDDFIYFVNYLHKKGIGVILDWVPAHFPKDEHGLADFDGQALYEYADPKMGEHPDWGTKVFDYSRTEVRNFLIANALYWLNEFHIDGLRVDAVASMLYLDYGRKAGEWVPNKYGGNQNLEAVEFFKHLNSLIQGRGDGTMIIAEESTSWPMVTHPTESGGLGFTYKWNMGWMHDFLEYMKLDPYFRKGAHNMMTFAMTYATSENFILVLSHDEVVHLKCSMISKMPGIYEDKFANLKCAYAFMFGHPGKKLLFMGQDFAQWHEWDEEEELDWQLKENPLHQGISDFYAALNTVYRKHSCLYELDDMWDGFEWVNADDCDRSIYSFIRYNRERKNSVLVVVNFTPMERADYMVGVPKAGRYKLILNEQGLCSESFKAEKGECDGRDWHIKYKLPPYGIAMFEF
ncbi:MAG: 1,4-alpha-glucan branching protein GlgB [Lachnospiraceae bacterium]|nr:1,4-alpha-glucan branching protein GlgB [Lachnospiraceae bacterium]